MRRHVSAEFLVLLFSHLVTVGGSQIVKKIKNCQPVLRANEGGYLEVFQFWLVEDVHERDPEVGGKEVPDCGP